MIYLISQDLQFLLSNDLSLR